MIKSPAPKSLFLRNIFTEATLQLLPNWITYFRVAIIPILVWLLISPSQFEVYVALVLFIIASISDVVDGYIARKYGAVSEFGKLLDPLADKVLVLAALIMLTSLKTSSFGEPWVPGWLVVAVAAREVWVTGLRGLAAQQNVIVAASSSGKWKTVIQMIGISALFLHDTPIAVGGFETSAQIIGLNLLILSLIFSYISGFEYTVKVLYASHEQGKVQSDDDSEELTH